MEPLIISSHKQLDKLVAEYVMGWTDINNIHWQDENGTVYETPIVHGRPYNDRELKVLPNYSTSITDSSDIISLLHGSCFIDILSAPEDAPNPLTTITITGLSSKEDNLEPISVIDINPSCTHKEYCVALCVAALKYTLNTENIIVNI